MLRQALEEPLVQNTLQTARFGLDRSAAAAPTGCCAVYGTHT